MKTVTNIADHRVSWIKARPLNSAEKLKEDERCPHCKQVHLRPGYCQALDRQLLVEAVIQKRANTPANVLTSVANITQDANADEEGKTERRKAYQRELMRKRRAEGKA